MHMPQLFLMPETSRFFKPLLLELEASDKEEFRDLCFDSQSNDYDDEQYDTPCDYTYDYDYPVDYIYINNHSSYCNSERSDSEK